MEWSLLILFIALLVSGALWPEEPARDRDDQPRSNSYDHYRRRSR